MRIQRVTMTGFGPFRGTETVDFEAFADDGIFLITGRTGAGKTTILDAVTFALYGRVPRYDGVKDGAVRSDHLTADEPTSVTVEFTTADGRYRITRSPEYQRPAKRGGGLTTQKASTELAAWDGGDWRVLETQARQAGERISEIVRLSAEEFLQVVLLAQGEFQEFLVASSRERQGLLRKLFGTSRFRDYADALWARREAQQQQLAAGSERIGVLVASAATELDVAVPPEVDPQSGAGVDTWIDDQATLVRDAVTRADVAETTAQKALVAAQEEFETVSRLAERQQRRAEAEARRIELEARADTITGLETRLAAARRAEVAWPAVRGHRRALAAHATAARAHREAERAQAAIWPDAPRDGDALTRAADDVTGRLATAQQALAVERSLPQREQAVAAADTTLAEFDRQLAERRAERERTRATRGVLDEHIAVLEPVAARRSELATRLDTDASRLEAIARAATTHGQLADAMAASADAERQRTEASRVLADLRLTRDAGFAGILAARLQPGVACVVCGSAEHPAPIAADTGRQVSDEEVAAAEAELDVAGDAARTSAQLVATLRERWRVESAAAGDEPAGVVRARYDCTADGLAEAEQAERERADAARRVRDLQAAADELTTLIDGADAERLALVATRAAAAQALETDLAEVTRARHAHPSVADRVATLQQRHASTVALIEALRGRDEAETARAEAEQALVEVLGEQQFADAAAVEEARLTAADQAAAESTVATHAADLAAVRATLADPQLQQVPAEPVDVDTPRDRRDAAGAAHREATRVKDTETARCRAIVSVASRLHDELDTAADQRRTYEVIDALANTVRGNQPNSMRMHLESFVLAAELEDIVAAANARLEQMTDRRYRFAHSDALAYRGSASGLDLAVVDAHTGRPRSPRSLSGGEKFQASLALALGLAEVVANRAGGIALDTLFIDEGFGSLDPETLETTMATLDGLREGGRTIGLISHVESLKETIPAQVRVDVRADGSSTLRAS